MDDAARRVREIVDRETRAWSDRDVESLLSIFHPDMVWVWPRTPGSHNPEDWETVMGKFDYLRWFGVYKEMFREFEVVRNNRQVVKIEVSREGDGAFAVVDIDTLWRNTRSGKDLQDLC